MTLNFANLLSKLPEDSIVWAGFGLPVQMNANAITGDTLTPESNPLETLARLLDALVQVESDVNAARAAATPALSPVNFVSKSIAVNGANPVYEWTLRIEVNASASLNNIVSPE